MIFVGTAHQYPDPLDDEEAEDDGEDDGETVTALVMALPDGVTSHHLAPNPSLPWPLTWPALVSPTK
jgi:hypothetical protein